MKKFYPILLCLLVCLLIGVSCEKPVSKNDTVDNNDNPYAVSVSDALGRLQSIIGEDNITRASTDESLVTVIRRSDFVPSTRSEESNDAVIYVVPFDEEDGCAILGADSRLDPVYAIMDNTVIGSSELLDVDDVSGDVTNQEELKCFVANMIRQDVMSDIAAMDTVLVSTRAPGYAPTAYTKNIPLSVQSPLLKSKWGQDYPYNKYMYNTDTQSYALAGCVTIALAQIMKYNVRPTSLNGVSFDWDLLDLCEYGKGYSSVALDEAARFIYKIKEVLGRVFKDSFDIYEARSCMINCGYSNVNISSYNLSTILGMVHDNKLPVFIGGYNDSGTGHAWVIDGCNSYITEYWWREYVGTEEPVMNVDTKVGEKRFDLLHCNYGWNGMCDGYYTSGIFNTSIERSNADIDSSVGDIVGSNENGNFNSGLTLLTYSL